MFKRKRFLVTCDFEKRAKARRQVGRHARTALFSALADFCKRREMRPELPIFRRCPAGIRAVHRASSAPVPPCSETSVSSARAACWRCREPSTSDLNLAHTIDGCTSFEPANEAKPQSAPAITRSRPTTSANRQSRCATNSGCSTSTVDCVMTTRDQHLVVGNLGALPLLPLVLVARVRCLERIGARVHLENDVDDVLELHVMDARPHVDAVAGVEANAVRRNALQRRVERLDAHLGPLAALGDAQLRPHDVIGDQERIVDLQQEPGVDDRLVFLAHRIGDREHILFRALVMLVRRRRLDVGRRDGGNEGLRGARSLQAPT